MMSASQRESVAAEPARPGMRFALRGAVRTAIGPLQQRARQRGIGLVCHVAPDLPDAVVGDGGRLAQLLVHLVGGAIRFTDEGEVALCLGLGAQVPPALVVLGSVADSGPGLPTDELRRLLDVGGAQGPARVASSVGSGLLAAAHLVHGMGGRIWLESERDHGTTVRFSIRLGVRHGEWWDHDGAGHRAARRARTLAAAGRGLDVLVAGEVGEHRVRVSRCLEALGHRVVAVSSGREAIAAAMDDDVDLAVIDLRMSRMDGFELAAVMRTLEGAGTQRVPILALNPTPLAGDQERCAAVGIDACIATAAGDDDEKLVDAVHRLHSQSHAVSESA
jgi:CheY-like chemotaxis protein